MKTLKTFDSFINSSALESNENFPPGAANDPSAPYNMPNYDVERDITIKPFDLKFKIVATDYKEFAILKEKSSGKMFMVGFSPEDLQDFVEYEKIPAGRNEDGIEYEYEYLEPDDYSIEAYATDKINTEGAGKGLDDFESSKVSEIDAELAQNMSDSLEEFVRMYASSNFRKDEIKKVQDMILVLKEILETIK